MGTDPSLSIRVATYNIGNKGEYTNVIKRGYQLGRGVGDDVHRAFNRTIQGGANAEYSNLGEKMNSRPCDLKG
ncbi:MAG: hypothetical protein JSS09_08420, partial [Verrucomicrobia bacterium]|nr:hypothetical protein [Verrucomicrobiota bacterium]